MDYSEEIDIPVLVAHGDDDQIVPINAVELKMKLLKQGTLKVYPGGGHGFVATNTDEFNAAVLNFIEGRKVNGTD